MAVVLALWAALVGLALWGVRWLFPPDTQTAPDPQTPSRMAEEELLPDLSDPAHDPRT